MTGVGIGMRFSNQVNTLNPASYSAVDSHTMIFDAGLSLQVSDFLEGGRRLNANNADFEYVVGSIRLFPKIGMTFGILAFTNNGYNYSGKSTVGVDDEGQPSSTSTETHSCVGGVHQAFICA